MEALQAWLPEATRRFALGLRDGISRELLRQLVESAPVAICVVRGPTPIVEFANAACRSLMAEVRPFGRRLQDLLPQCSSAIADAEAQDALEKAGVWTLRGQLRPGVSPVAAGGAWNWVVWRVPVSSRDPRLALLGYEVGVERAELKSAERALSDAHASSRAKDALIARLLHELRGPLAPIAAALELLRGREPVPQDRVWAVLNRQVKYLIRLINDMSEVNRSSHSGLTLNRERVELTPMVEQAVELAEPVLHARRHALTVEVAKDLFIEADPGRLVQIIANLLTNAAKYTHEGGTISVSTRRVEAEVIITVSDNGIGIAAEVLPNVFDMFVRSPRAQRERDGMGVGLYVVRALVRQHGGTVEARSAGPGLGSEFIVRLPSSSVVQSEAL